ncbi:MAG TPA: DUF2442 domain-containing protein [Bacteroidales bacterium]|nr:DUF2442 domain-containing protein [Bacteroidales bacterium]HQB21851.1 DUF2442 domain-containing protein [Bacteroidales bacterium]
MKQIVKVWTTDTEIWVEDCDGQRGFELFEDYPRLRNATQAERNDYEITHSGLRWNNLDEDLCFEGFFEKKKYTSLYRFFMQHPELNASAIARRLGISQSLFAQYISGHKQASKEREKAILEEIRKIGGELSAISI